jgi:molybdenum cofactor biosynthesis protein B
VSLDPERAFLPVRIAVLTVSDTRGPEDDRSGDLLAERLTAAGHVLADRAWTRDDQPAHHRYRPRHR